MSTLTERWKKHTLSQKVALRDKLIEVVAIHEGWEESAVALVDEAIMPVIQQHESDIIIENDRVCINGKWYFAMPVAHAVTSAPPQKTAQ